MKSILLAGAVLFVLASAASGQRTLGESMDLTGPKVCGTGTYGEVETFVGTVMKRDFAENETTVSGFVLRDKKDQRFYFNLDVDFLSQFSGNTVDSISEALTVGNLLRVKADHCAHIYMARRVKVLKQ